MDVLERVQGCNRIIVQGHMEIEDRRVEGEAVGERSAESTVQSQVGPSMRMRGKGP